nr:TPA_exp: hypothetical protein CAETHG_RS14400_2 [Clostridium autoethanogenum DSM 10061]
MFLFCLILLFLHRKIYFSNKIFRNGDLVGVSYIYFIWWVCKFISFIFYPFPQLSIYRDVNSEYEPLKTDFAQRTPGKYLVPFTISFIGMASSVSLPEGLYSAL